MTNRTLFSILDTLDNDSLRKFAKKSGISIKKLRYYNDELIFPSINDLEKILDATNFTEVEFRLKLGVLDSKTLDLLSNFSHEIDRILPNQTVLLDKEKNFYPSFSTELGQLYQEDSLALMKTLPSQSIDLIFADPPFNLDKVYESGMNDKLNKDEYLRWTEEWVLDCVRLLKEGGSFFIWNLPSWNTYTAEILNKHLTLRHWIAVDIKYSLPKANKLYPSHYSLLYFTKGDKPNTFNPERLPLEICRHCAGDIKDYGGYKNKLNVNGISLPDVWRDISPVRHKKYKTRDSNQLPVNLLERIISMASNEGDLVFDPFGGSGTTFIVSEILNRKWIGSEIGPINQIIQRFEDIEFHRNQIIEIKNEKNTLFTDYMRKRRIENSHWLPETLNKQQK